MNIRKEAVLKKLLFKTASINAFNFVINLVKIYHKKKEKY